ncbi:MAG: DUF1365 domain-containing protein, partial [Algiphilus sp.]
MAPLYRFVYRVFYLLVDIDRLAETARRHRLFSYNRFNVLSFHDRDHGVAPGGLRAWVDRTLAARGIRLGGGRVRVLCMPRVLGHVFNPISLFYCEDAGGALRAVIAEVRNTFGERHCYVLEAGGDALEWEQPLGVRKRFHVSPFMALEGGYRFRLQEPGERLRVGRQTRGARARAAMTLRAEYQPGINMPDGPSDAINKWSRKITQPKSQGASQVRDEFAFIYFP